eukprot:Opistho-2@93727
MIRHSQPFLRSLEKLRFLDLSCASELEDVSAARNVHELILRKCFLLNDVSALGSVHTLLISSVGPVLNVSALSEVHTLEFFDVNLVGVAKLTGVHYLSLSSVRFDV